MYDLIIGSNATAQSRADFIEAVNTAGGPNVCIDGPSESAGVLVQAVRLSTAQAAKLKLWFKRRPSKTVKLASAK